MVVRFCQNGFFIHEMPGDVGEQIVDAFRDFRFRQIMTHRGQQLVDFVKQLRPGDVKAIQHDTDASDCVRKSMSASSFFPHVPTECPVSG